jgi:hypothetical protein
MGAWNSGGFPAGPHEALVSPGKETTMRRRLLGSLIVGSGLALFASTLATTFAQDDANRNSPGSERTRESGSDEAAQRVDKAIQDYQNRMSEELEHTRKGIDRMRKELRELTETRIDMAIALAELKADSAAHGHAFAFPGAPGAAGAYPSPGGAPITTAASNEPASENERQHRRASALNQELRQVAEALHNELQTERSQTDQCVAQLRALRAQNRQLREQMKAAQERNRTENRDQKRGQPTVNASPAGEKR